MNTFKGILLGLMLLLAVDVSAATKRIWIDLDENEQAEFAGALLYYRANPAVAPMRFVLSQKSRARIAQLDEQFFPAPTPPSAVPILDVAWGDGSRKLLQGFQCGGVAMRFTVPATPIAYSAPGYISLAEYQGPPTLRQVTLSRVAGDFRPLDPSGTAGPIADSRGVQSTIDFSAGGAGTMGLAPGQTYFFSFRNWSQGLCSCSVSSCNASFSTNWPH